MVDAVDAIDTTFVDDVRASLDCVATLPAATRKRAIDAIFERCGSDGSEQQGLLKTTSCHRKASAK